MKSKEEDSKKNKSVPNSRWPTGVPLTYKDKRRFSEITNKKPLTFNSIKNIFPQKIKSIKKADISENNSKKIETEISSLFSSSVIQAPNHIINFKIINLFKIFFVINGLLALFTILIFFINIGTNIIPLKSIGLFIYINFMLVQLMIAILCIFQIPNYLINFKIIFTINGILALFITLYFFINNIGALNSSRAIISSNFLINILFVLLQLTLTILCFYLCASLIKIKTKNSETMTSIPAAVIILTPKTLYLVIWSIMLVFLGAGSSFTTPFVLALIIELLITWYFFKNVKKIINTIWV